MDGAGALAISVANSLSEVSPAAWNAVANPPGAAFDPFLTWEFLEALERSGSATARTGWAPAHVLAHEAGALVAAMPLYLKSHSYGEYVFDHSWADAMMRAGGRYYPKLQCAVPFTPATGRRLLTCDASPDRERALINGALELMRQAKASSLHITFPTHAEWSRLRALGLLARTGVQFHWSNQGYATYADFLAALSSQKRKNLRKERARAVEGLTIRRLVGADIHERDWDFFFRCYMDTGSRKWGSPYLNREAFSLLGERLADHILLLVAERAGRPIASALNFIGSETLFGRYWGCVDHVDFLHFELCYHQAIDFAIERGLARVEAGAQGEHKLARGYAPTEIYSAHAIAHAGLRDAIASYLASERPAIAEEVEYLAGHAPFRRDGGE
ncbi:MAG: GNAT family N-acetyltransferase [Alphaproteobacteria bacterium]|nr:GNAT family N-acetyltransferase [Alphaproteobacteria bacterium]